MKKGPAQKADKLMFHFLVIIPIGIAACVRIWAKHGFGYALLTALIYAPLAYLKFIHKK